MADSVVVTTTADVVVVSETTSYQTIVTGLQGPPGPTGPIGPSGDAFVLTAASTLSGHRALAINGDGQAIYAQHTDATALAVQGLSAQSGIVGEDLVVSQSGPLAWPAGDLTPGLPLFLTTDGQLAHTPPTTGWLRQIAVAVDADTISIDIGPAIRLTE